MSSYCEQYYTPPGFASSLPDYLWLEAGTNFGILDSAETKKAHHVYQNFDIDDTRSETKANCPANPRSSQDHH